MIEFESASFRYSASAPWVFRDVTLTIPDAELTLLIGATGSGKSTFLRSINGLVPHFTGGELYGHVRVAGRDTRAYPPRALADVVGMVMQDPIRGFVTDTAEDELAFSMESLGVDPAIMRRRTEEIIDLLSLHKIRQRPLRTLSGGEQQRVAIGAALTSHPSILILDEPTSALDPGAAEDVLAALQRLVHDVGMCVVVAEHRLDRVMQFADHALVIDETGIRSGSPTALMATSTIAPPVVELGRLAGWDPLPLSIREARKVAAPLRALLAAQERPLALVRDTPSVVTAHDVTVSYGRSPAVRSASITVARGEIHAVMGRNGAGKTTLLHTIAGIHTPTSGLIQIDNKSPHAMKGSALVQHIGLVPQNPGDLFEATTVSDECKSSDRDARITPGTTRALLALLAPDIEDHSHPADLSSGQQLLLALAIVLAAKPAVVVLDEPTRGLDYGTKKHVGQLLQELADAGHAVIVATHDVELTADIAHVVSIMAEGEIVATGPTSEIVLSSPMFAPQVAKVLAPERWLTVADVQKALAGGA